MRWWRRRALGEGEQKGREGLKGTERRLRRGQAASAVLHERTRSEGISCRVASEVEGGRPRSSTNGTGDPRSRTPGCGTDASGGTSQVSS